MTIYIHILCMQSIMVANPARGQLNLQDFLFACPLSRLRIWPRETGLAVPSRVSQFIVHPQAESGAYSRASSSFPRRRPFIYYIFNRDWVRPMFIRSRKYCVPMASTAESPPAQGQYPRGSSSNGCCLIQVVSPWTTNFCAPLFSHTDYTILY